MKLTQACWIILVGLATGVPGAANADGNRELKVHLAQANNDSPYAFVRAKFNPGEVADPWSVRFFDAKGEEVPFFVWDSVTWRVAQEGRADWGHRYALLNHAPGGAPEVVEARANKLQAAKKNLPELGAALEAREQAAKKAPDSVCAALYLLRRRMPAFGKERLTLRIYSKPQVEPKRRVWKGDKVDERVAVKQGELEFRDLPDRLAVVWKGKEIVRCAGFQAGERTDTTSHADPSRPFVVETAEGIITKVTVTAQTKGRQDGAMDWQCCYWLFPDGGYVALEGFSLSDTADYVGGPQKLSVWQADGKFAERHSPQWETPWWLHQAGEGGFVATHLFHATPLTIGFGNNPFAVNAEGTDKDPKVESDGQRLALSWSHRLDDPAITRIMAPQPLRRPGDPQPKDPPKPLRWKPKVDWLYRQYAAGLGEKADAAEASLRAVLGAAAGWIDRPVSEEEVAALLVTMMPRIADSRESAEIGLLKIVPAALKDDPKAIKDALARTRDQAERTDYYIKLIRRHVELGGKPSEGRKKDDPDGTPREGWTGNPCYHAALMPCYVRVLEHFELPFRQKEYREAILRYADFTLELLGGKPTDFDKFNEVCQTEWPSRIVPILPLMLHAYTLKPEEKYARAVKVLFGDLTALVERNPHGYWPAWSFHPKADKFDTVYNPVAYERGITALWSEGQLELVGRDKASRFVVAQARWLVYSGQLLDTLETDNATAIRASTHGAHTNNRNQIGLYLYDDFDFYRGLVADLVTWSAASSQVTGQTDPTGTGAYRALELSNAGSSMLRWALAIRPGSKWQESKVQRLPMDGAQLLAWNRKPQAKPTFKLTAQEAGLKAEAPVLEVQLNGPAYREPAEYAVSWTADKLSLKVGKPAKVRVYYRVLRPEWPAKDKLLLQRLRRGDSAEVVKGDDVVWRKEYVEWPATPGEYELLRDGK
jgi:hypothetical protein